MQFTRWNDVLAFDTHALRCLRPARRSSPVTSSPVRVPHPPPPAQAAAAQLPATSTSKSAGGWIQELPDLALPLLVADSALLLLVVRDLQTSHFFRWLPPPQASCRARVAASRLRLLPDAHLLCTAVARLWHVSKRSRSWVWVKQEPMGA